MSNHGSNNVPSSELRLSHSHVFIARYEGGQFVFIGHTRRPCARVARASCATYDEAKVAPYTLPDPLTFRQWGQTYVTRSVAETASRNPRPLRGPDEPPDSPRPLPKCVWSCLKAARYISGRTTRKQVRMWFPRRQTAVRRSIGSSLSPRDTHGPVPAFIGLNYYGNQETDADPGDPQVRKLAPR